MFGNNANTTTDLMLPILLDMANLIRRAVRSGKQSREVRMPMPPPANILRRSFTEDTHTDHEDTVTEEPKSTPNTIIKRSRRIVQRTQAKNIAQDHNRTVANDTKHNTTEAANAKSDEVSI